MFPGEREKKNGNCVLVGMLQKLSKSSVFPSWNALWPTLGTACIVFSGKTQNQGFVNLLLKQPFLVWIGLLSYSIYLWHWPILVIGN